jgi:hypothetical protein
MGSLEQKIDALTSDISFIRQAILTLLNSEPVKRQAFPLYRADGSRRNQRRPAWWANEPLREWMLANHRLGTVGEATARAEAAFGAGCISRSSMSRFWLAHDEVAS